MAFNGTTYDSKLIDKSMGITRLEQPEDCSTCINRKHPEACRKSCPTLRRNCGCTLKKSKDLGGISNA